MKELELNYISLIMIGRNTNASKNYNGSSLLSNDKVINFDDTLSINANLIPFNIEVKPKANPISIQHLKSVCYMKQRVKSFLKPLGTSKLNIILNTTVKNKNKRSSSSVMHKKGRINSKTYLQSKLSRNEENIVKMCSIKEKPSRIKENKSVSSENIRVKYKEEDKNAAFANRIRELLEIAKRSDGIKPLLNTSSFKKGLIIEYNRNALRNNNTYNLTKKLQVKEDTIRQFSEIMKWGNNVEKYHKVNYY